jgi:hypothetical protein
MTTEFDDWDPCDPDDSDDDSDGYPDWYDHPSLSAAERNSLMGVR